MTLYLDDGTEADVVIKASHDAEEDEDEQIFFYGILSKQDILDSIKNQVPFENEWIILELYEATDTL